MSSYAMRLSEALVHQYAIARDTQDALRRGDDIDARAARDRGAFWAASRGDADCLSAALRNGIEITPAADALEAAAGHADPTCVRLILAEWGERFYHPHIDRAVERAAWRGNAETLAELLPYWRVNKAWRETFSLRFRDAACAALLNAAEVAV